MSLIHEAQCEWSQRQKSLAELQTDSVFTEATLGLVINLLRHDSTERPFLRHLKRANQIEKVPLKTSSHIKRTVVVRLVFQMARNAVERQSHICRQPSVTPTN